MSQTPQRIDIYGNRDKVYGRAIILLNNAEISQRNKDIVKSWVQHLFATNSKEVRIAKLLLQIRIIIEKINKDLDKLDKADIEFLVSEFNKDPKWSEATKADYKRAVKQFYSWFEEHDSRIEQGDKIAAQMYLYIKKYIKKSYDETPADFGSIISEEDIRLVIEKGCKDIREKAFLSVLHEGGFRAGEILNVRIQNLKISNEKVIVEVDGKTGKRGVPLVVSMGLLLRWLDEHPQKDNPEAFLWIGFNRRTLHDPLRHVGATKLVNRCFRRAGIHKQHNLHWFRHSRATLNAPHLREALLCRFFGWAIGSKQVKTYVHADVSQVEDAIMKMNGLSTEEDNKIKVIICQTCSMNNDPGARYCRRCGKPLSVTIMLEDENKKNAATDEALKFLQFIMSNPELKTKFEEFQAKS